MVTFWECYQDSKIKAFKLLKKKKKYMGKIYISSTKDTGEMKKVTDAYQCDRNDNILLYVEGGMLPYCAVEPTFNMFFRVVGKSL